MRKSFTVPAAIVLSLAATVGAFSKDMKATIKTVDTATSSITLDNGQMLTLPPSVKADSLKVGEKVQITYSTDAYGKTAVQSITPTR